MTLKIERNLVSGVPQTAVVGFVPHGISWHWTAGGTGRTGALSTLKYLVSSRLTINASYHILLFREGSDTVAMWIVDSGRASHSMNPAKAYVPKTGSAREKARFTEVHRILARDYDPNADCISVSFCGMPADLKAAMADPVFVADVRELARQLIARPSVIDRPHFGHGWIQPITRYETDEKPEGTDLLIARLYEEEDMYEWTKGIKPAHFQTTIDPYSQIRYAPDLTAGSKAFLTGSNTATLKVIGLVEGAEYQGTTQWLVYVQGSGGLTVTHGANEVDPAKRIQYEPADEDVVGFTQAEMDSAKAAARKAGIADAAAAAAATK